MGNKGTKIHKDIKNKQEKDLEKKKLFRIGSNLFDSEKIAQNQITSPQKYVLVDKAWNIVRVQANKLNKWQKIFTALQATDISSVNISQNHFPQIVKTISHIQFVDLRFLYLIGNNITNIQPLTFLSCKGLCTLILTQNLINRVKSFQKWKDFSTIQRLSLSGNPITQLKLSRTKLQQQIRITLQTFIFQQSRDLISQQYIVDLLKMQKSQSGLIMNSPQRIDQKKIYKQFIYRNQKIMLKTYIRFVQDMPLLTNHQLLRTYGY